MVGRNAAKTERLDLPLPENDAHSARQKQHQMVPTMVPRFSKSAEYGAGRLASDGYQLAPICRTRSKNGPP